MKLLSSIKCPKGITLNSQLVDLLSILDDNTISRDEQDARITTYIADLVAVEKTYKSLATEAERGSFIINKIVKDLKLPENFQYKLKQLYLDANKDKTIFDLDKLNELLLANGFDESINIQVLKGIRNLDLETKDGLYRLTPQKVRAFYAHLFKDGNTYDRVTFDNAGKYSSYVSVDGKTYADERLEKMITFCEKHGMKSKINTLFMYCDFPKKLEEYLLERKEKGEISGSDVKQTLKESLFNYVRDIGKKYGDRIDTLDIFNELIYDDQMKETGFDEDPSYHPRKEGWQKYLSIEDMCEMALEARKLMPNVKFTYNDMHWLEPKKRKEIINIIKSIKDIEKIYQMEGKLANGETLIDNIGLEAHLTTGDATKDKISQMDKTIEELKAEIGLPIEITELDVARTGTNKNSKSEEKKQNKIFRKIMQLVQKGEISALTIWSPSDDLSFMNDKMNCAPNETVHASVLNSDFTEKDIGRETLKDKIVRIFSKIKQKKLPDIENKDNIIVTSESLKSTRNTNEIDEMREKYAGNKNNRIE